MATWQPISDSIAAHAEVRKVVDLGYSISFSWRPDSPHLDLRAQQGGRTVSRTCIQFYRPGREQFAENAHTDEGHRGRGIMSALFVVAELLTGCTSRPASNQTDDGRRLWAQPNRPFGNPAATA